MFFLTGTQMKKMVEQISFLLHAQKFSRNMHPAKNVRTKQSENVYEKTSRNRLQSDQS